MPDLPLGDGYVTAVGASGTELFVAVASDEGTADIWALDTSLAAPSWLPSRVAGSYALIRSFDGSGSVAAGSLFRDPPGDSEVDGMRPAVWVRDAAGDGWSLTELRGHPAQLSAIAGQGDRRVAVGQDDLLDRGDAGWCGTAAAWLLVDGQPRRPSKLTAEPCMVAPIVVSTASGFIVAAAPNAILASVATAPTMWRSLDGEEWVASELPQAVFPANSLIDAFASDGAVLVAIGRTCTSALASCRAAAWYSPNGQSWEAADLGSHLAAGRSEVIWLGDGYFALSSSGPGFAVVSADGQAWQPAPPPPTSREARTWLTALDGAAAVVDANGGAWLLVDPLP